MIGNGGGAINGTGNSSNNTITGNSSINVLNGGAGNDTLTGGGGADTFLFNTALNASTNVDTITDFIRGTDKIGLASALFGAIGGTLDAGELRSGAGFTTAADANDYLIYNSTTGDLYYDAGGVGGAAAVKFAKLNTTLPALTVNDFTIV